MNRRSFLRILAGTAAASTTAYFLPPIGGWKSDVIAHAEWHVKEIGPSEFVSWIGPQPPSVAYGTEDGFGPLTLSKRDQEFLMAAILKGHRQWRTTRHHSLRYEHGESFSAVQA